MLYFESDYTEGAHPAVLARLAETNLVTVKSYGADEFSAAAAEKIRAACGCPGADVTFLTGGTQTNLVVISSLLRPYEGVIAAQTGHINGHEAGAIEYTGHKVLALPHHEGKVSAADVAAYCRAFYADGTYPHMVHPGMVYISHPTEYGTLYSKAELEALAAVCREYKMPLFMDGARLGYGLMSRRTDV
ncbi:MAG: low specificity L-threonine aldolase, partial [Clostridia bacterium]|nr:low specificity L-threonine aldolase [Clostridia bacterium]